MPSNQHKFNRETERCRMKSAFAASRPYPCAASKVESSMPVCSYPRHPPTLRPCSSVSHCFSARPSYLRSTRAMLARLRIFASTNSPSFCTMATTRRVQLVAPHQLSLTRQKTSAYSLPFSSARRPKRFRILGLESSADDTCAAVVDSDRRLLSSVVRKQHDIHSR